MLQTFRDSLLAIFWGSIGLVFAMLLNFPAPFLTGPALIVTLACLFGIKMSIHPFLRDTCFIVIGIGMGSSITPDVMATVVQWPAGFIILTIMLLLIMFSGVNLLQRLFKYNKQTAILASSPGHLSYIVALSLDGKANTQQVTLGQSIRVLALTLIVPFIVMFLNGEPLETSEKITEIMLIQNMIIIFCGAILCSWLLQQIKTPAAFLLGGMFVSATGHLSNLTPGQLPEWLSISAFMIMGTIIGTRFNGITLKIFRSSLYAGAVITFNAAFFAISAAYVASFFVDVPITQLLIAFAPGGLEAMAALAVLLNAEPSFVAAHHVMRLVLLTFLIPLISEVYKKNDGEKYE